MSLKVGLGASEDDLEIQGEIDFDFFEDEEKGKKTSLNKQVSFDSRKKTLIETVIPSLVENCHLNHEDMNGEEECHSPTSSVSMTDSDVSSLSEDSFEDLTESDSITDVTPLTSPCCDSPLPGFYQNENVNRKESCTSSDASSSGSFSVKKKENVKFADDSQWNTAKNNTVDLNALLHAIQQLEIEQNKNSGQNKNYKVTCLNSRQKNMSFSNEEVRHIDQENQRLLKKILSQQNRPLPKHVQKSHPLQSHMSSSAVNRLRQQRQIELENLALLKRIEAAKPSKDLSRAHLLRDFERLSSFSCSSRASSRPQSANRKPYQQGRNSIQQSLRSSSLSSLHSSNSSKVSPSPVPSSQGKSKHIRPVFSSKSYISRQHQTSNSSS